MHLCLNCGNQVTPKTATPGSVAIELLIIALAVTVAFFDLTIAGVLFLIFIVYGVWRLSNKKQVCPTCSAENPVPIDSPAAQRYLSGR